MVIGEAEEGHLQRRRVSYTHKRLQEKDVPTTRAVYASRSTWYCSLSPSSICVWLIVCHSAFSNAALSASSSASLPEGVVASLATTTAAGFADLSKASSQSSPAIRSSRSEFLERSDERRSADLESSESAEVMRVVVRASWSVVRVSSRVRVEVEEKRVLLVDLSEVISDLALEERGFSGARERDENENALLELLAALSELAFEMGEVSLAGGGARFGDGSRRVESNEGGLLLLELGDPSLGGGRQRGGLEGRELKTERGDSLLQNLVLLLRSEEVRGGGGELGFELRAGRRLALELVEVVVLLRCELLDRFDV